MAARPPLRFQVLYCRNVSRNEPARRAADAVAEAVLLPLPVVIVAGVGLGAAESRGLQHRKQVLPKRIGLLVWARRPTEGVEPILLIRVVDPRPSSSARLGSG
jgi:hypothetical protein